MSLIKKKAQMGLAGSISQSDIFAPWQSLHASVCTYVSTAIGTDFVPGPGRVDSGAYKTLANEMPENLIGFSLGMADIPNMTIMAIEPWLASRITATKLSQSDNVDSKKTEPAPLGLLDVLLLQPFADLVAEELNGLLELINIDKGTNLVGRTGYKLDLREFKMDPASGEWVKLAFPIESETSSDTKNEKKGKSAKPKGDKKAKSNAGPTPAAIHLLVPKELLEEIAAAHEMHAPEQEFDPTEPWAVHMSEAVGHAEVCVKAILETCELSVAECTRLSIGQIIRLPSVSLQNIGLETSTDSGVVELAFSNLGTYKSNRAVQLSEDISPEFISDLDTITI